MTPELRRVLEGAFPGEEARYVAPTSIGPRRPSAPDVHRPPTSIGGTPSEADSGAAAILDGTKTVTSSAPWDWPDGRIPFAGASSILLDGQGRARAIVETERVEIRPFGSVDEDFVRACGEGDRTLAWWRSEIGPWHRASAARHGEDFSDDTPLICEWIAVVRRL